MGCSEVLLYPLIANLLKPKARYLSSKNLNEEFSGPLLFKDLTVLVTLSQSEYD